MAQRGARDVDPELALQVEVVDLDDDAVDLVVEVVAVLLPPGAERQHLVEAVHQVDLGVDREPGPAQPGQGGRLAGGQLGQADPSARTARGAPRPPGRPRTRAPAPAVTDGSFWRSEPAAEFRGLTNSRSPASAWRRLRSSKAAMGM